MVTFMLGVLISIPVSIFANVMTPRWQKFWSKRSEGARQRNEAAAREYVGMVDWLKDHPEALIASLVSTLGGLFVTTATATLSLVAAIGVCAYVAYAPHPQVSKSFYLVVAVALIVMSYLSFYRVMWILSRLRRLTRAMAEEWYVNPITLRPKIVMVKREGSAFAWATQAMPKQSPPKE